MQTRKLSAFHRQTVTTTWTDLLIPSTSDTCTAAAVACSCSPSGVSAASTVSAVSAEITTVAPVRVYYASIVL